jgi:hypothetical protein
MSPDNKQQSSRGNMTRRQLFAAGGATAAGALALTVVDEAPGEPAPVEPARAAAENQALPPFIQAVAKQGKPASPRDVAEKTVIKLNSAMHEPYVATLSSFKRNFREQFPILVALFSGQGGQMLLYPPGRPPVVADRVPVAYELAKAVSHSPMAVYQVIAPYLKEPAADSSWKAPMRTFRTQNQAALGGLAALDLSREDKDALAGILKRNIGFMDRCLEKGAFTFGELQEFARGHKPFLSKAHWLAGNTQVSHWMKVLDGWKKMLGKEWDRLYGVTDTLYMTRQNNILFTILAQYMGQGAINERLLLFETTEFTTTPEKLIGLLTHLVADRSLGKVFFNDCYLMDTELISDPARRAIREQVARREMKLVVRCSKLYSPRLRLAGVSGISR